jgi:Spy/CpxP family protein refolding chaperone
VTPPRLATGAWLVLAALLPVAPAEAQQRQERRSPEREAPPAERQVPGTRAEALVDRSGERVAEALGLDRSQRSRLIAELQRSRREREALAERRRRAMQGLAGLVRSDRPDEARVASLLEELLELRVRQAEVDREEDRRLSEFLTPLQRARLLHLKQRLAERALDARLGGGRRRP